MQNTVVQEKNHQLTALIALFLTALMWSLGGVAFKPLVWQGAPNSDWLIASWRSVFAATVFLLIFVGSRLRLGFQLPRLRPGMFVSVASYAALVLTFVVSTRWTSTAEAVFLQYTAPTFAALILWLVFKKRQSQTDVYAIVLGAAGLSFLFINQIANHGQGSMQGNLIAVLSGLCFAVYCVAPKAADERITILFYGNLLASVPALVALTHGAVPPLNVAASLAGYSLLTTVIPFLLFTWACHHCGELSSLLITSLEPVLATVWAVVFFGETLNYMILAGCLLVLLASLLSAPIVELVMAWRRKAVA